MKKVMIGIFLLLGVTVNVFAQGTSKFEAYGNAGISFPIGPEDFSKYWKMGFNFGIGGGYVINPNLTLITYADFNSFSFDGDKWLKDNGLGGYGISLSGGGISIYTFSENLKITLPTTQSPVHPYLCGGAGLFIFSVNDIESNDSTFTGKGYSENAFSVLLGAGADIAMGERVSLFVEGKYAIGFTKKTDGNTQILPIKIGIKFR